MKEKRRWIVIVAILGVISISVVLGLIIRYVRAPETHFSGKPSRAGFYPVVERNENFSVNRNLQNQKNFRKA
jgi:flagellar basal body-associated protein FliL